MTRKWDNSFQNRAIWGIKHKSVAKGLAELLTKLNMLSASCNSLCNCKNVERFFCPQSEDFSYSKTVSTKHIKSIQKKTIMVWKHLPLDIQVKEIWMFFTKIFYSLFSVWSSWLHLDIRKSFTGIYIVDIAKHCFHTWHVCSWKEF